MKDSSTATERVGRYQLLEPIGGGPNGMVSRAKVFGVAGFERQFAVKRFSPELTVGTAAQALSAAARSYGSLEHPRIARMSEFGVAQGQTFTAVEYVAGLDAFRLLQEAKLAAVAIPPGGALALVSQAARAVGYAHGRGLSHLGLSPTNVIVTVDGDVKVTDFGILAAAMPPRPVETPRLAHRIPYLAPEQLAGESTSAATDVFVLGVIAYELVTGQRAYRGDTPGTVAQAILAGPPAEPPLPRPIVRVLQRCLARSPFERFPDARALADALDAALRVAPVPGTRKEIGAQIKMTLDRYAQLNEGNLSGMVALNLTNASAGGGALDAHDVSTQPFMRPDAKTDVSPVVPQAAATLTDLPKPFSTVAGLAPPPIPVPPGIASPPNPIPAPSTTAPKTMLGLPPIAPIKKPQIPGVIPPIGKPNGPSVKPPIPSRATPPPMPAVRPPSDVPDEVIEPSGLLEISDLTPPPGAAPNAATSTASDSSDSADSGKMPAQDPATMQGTGVGVGGLGTLSPTALSRPPKPTPGQSFESQTGEMSSTMLDELNRRSVKNTSEIESIKPPPESAAPALIEVSEPSEPSEVTTPAGAGLAADRPVATMLGVAASSVPPASRAPSPTSPPRASSPTSPPRATSPTSPPRATSPTSPPRTKSPTLQPGGTTAARPRSRAPIVLLVLLLFGGLGAAGYYFYTQQQQTEQTDVVAETPSTKKPDTKAVTPPVADAGVAKPAVADAAVIAKVTPDAATVVAPPADAGAIAEATIDASVDTAAVVKPTATSDKLKITSKPKGARVFIDGADQGQTPVTLPGSADRHTMVLLLPGHDLYVGEIDGRGVFDISLKPVTPSGGFAGIKVIKCKAKERYYVYVDGKPTGMTCPTERIDTVVGSHVVEVYDIVTDSRRKWDIYVKDERLSFRVRIDN